MSYCTREIEGLPILSDEMNNFLRECVTTLVPSEKFIAELPAPFKDDVKPFRLYKQICNPFLDAILDFEIQSNDIFVCSLPKCGSSWMQITVWLLTHDLNYEAVKKLDRSNQMGDFDELLNATAAIEISSEFRANDKSLSESDALKMGWNEVFKKLDTTRIIKSHHPPYLLPKQIWSKGAKIIYVVRNPKDMAVSLYYMVRNFFHADLTMDDIVNAITNDVCCYSPCIDHVLDFWKLKHSPNVLFVAYEDAVNDSFETIKKISEFLNCNYSDEQLKELTEFISFDNMKQIKSINREDDVVKMESLHGKKRPDADFT